MDDKIPLTHLSHKSGCGSKLSPQILHALLGTGPLAGEYPDLLVGYNTMDDAAIYQIDPGQAIVATADFLTPIVNDPYQFGQIAAASALSDVYAMGGRPTFALALLGFPGLLIPVEAARKILEGGAAMCKQAGIPICGGHSIDSPEIFYGLSVIGTVHPDAIVRNSTASPGDVIILTKALGMGVFAEAIRRGEIDPKAYKIMFESGTQLNNISSHICRVDGIHAMTDVSGFGLVGHSLEMAKASHLSAQIRIADVPVLPQAGRFAKNGFFTSTGTRNFNSYNESLILAEDGNTWQRNLLFEPETNGGLLISVAPGSAEKLLAILHSSGFNQAAIVGKFISGEPLLELM